MSDFRERVLTKFTFAIILSVTCKGHKPPSQLRKGRARVPCLFIRKLLRFFFDFVLQKPRVLKMVLEKRARRKGVVVPVDGMPHGHAVALQPTKAVLRAHGSECRRRKMLPMQGIFGKGLRLIDRA